MAGNQTAGVLGSERNYPDFGLLGPVQQMLDLRCHYLRITDLVMKYALGQ